MAIKTRTGRTVRITGISNAADLQSVDIKVRTIGDGNELNLAYPLVFLCDDSNGEEIRQALKLCLYTLRPCVLCMRSCMAEKFAAAVLCDTCKR